MIPAMMALINFQLGPDVPRRRLPGYWCDARDGLFDAEAFGERREERRCLRIALILPCFDFYTVLPNCISSWATATFPFRSAPNIKAGYSRPGLLLSLAPAHPGFFF